MCREPLDPGESKFHRGRHGFDCKIEFYSIMRQIGPTILPRLLMVRETRPRRKGEPMTEAAKAAHREARQLIDEALARLRAGRAALRARQISTTTATGKE